MPGPEPEPESDAEDSPPLAEVLAARVTDGGRLGLGFVHSASGPAIVASVADGSPAAACQIRAGMQLCRIGRTILPSGLPCTAALDLLRPVAGTWPLELGFGWPVHGEHITAAQQLWGTLQHPPRPSLFPKSLIETPTAVERACAAV